jgi:hypothetical protein
VFVYIFSRDALQVNKAKKSVSLRVGDKLTGETRDGRLLFA